MLKDMGTTGELTPENFAEKAYELQSKMEADATGHLEEVLAWAAPLILVCQDQGVTFSITLQDGEGNITSTGTPGIAANLARKGADLLDDPSIQ
jgi:hypothetical protein